MTTPQTTPALPLAQSLEYVITWLEGGCDPREAAKELRLIQAPVTAAPQEGVSVPPGWKLVPLEPTLDMSIAFAEQFYSQRRAIDDHDISDWYTAMLAAAPQPPASAPPDTGNVGAKAYRKTVTGEQAYHTARGEYEVAQIKAKRENWPKFAALSPINQAYWVAKTYAAALPPPGRGMVPMTEAKAREHLEALLDIWDDARKPYEHRAYVDGAFSEQLEEIRVWLAAATPLGDGEGAR